MVNYLCNKKCNEKVLFRYIFYMENMEFDTYLKIILPSQMQMHAPITEIIRLPSILSAPIPMRLNTSPPTNPPRIPKMILRRMPPPLFIILPAIKPASAPNSNPIIKFICVPFRGDYAAPLFTALHNIIVALLSRRVNSTFYSDRLLYCASIFPIPPAQALWDTQDSAAGKLHPHDKHSRRKELNHYLNE